MSSRIENGLNYSEQESKTAKLLFCLEHGGERLNDEAIGLRKTYSYKPL